MEMGVALCVEPDFETESAFIWFLSLKDDREKIEKWRVE